MKKIYYTPSVRAITIDVQCAICNYSEIHVEGGGTDPKSAKEDMYDENEIW